MSEKNDIKYPRCGSVRIIEYDKSFDCVDCRLEFSKSSLEQFDEENILSFDESKKIHESLEDVKKPSKRKKE